MSVSQVRHRGPHPSLAGVDAPHTSVVTGLDEAKQLVHCMGATSLMDCLRLRKAGNVSQDVVDQAGLQPVASPSALPSHSGELGGPSSAATEMISGEPASARS